MKKTFLSLFIACVFLAVGHADPIAARSFILDYGFVIKDIPPDASEIRVWVPVPPPTGYQTVEDLSPSSDTQSAVTREDKYGNVSRYYSIKPSGSPKVSIDLKYKITRDEVSRKPRISPFHEMRNGSEDLKKFLAPSKLVTISPRVKKMALEITGDKQGDVEKAEAIYAYVFKNVDYDKTAPGWGRGDTERVCDVKKGNCTDFHSLFISLAMASGIPARFVIGVQLPKGEGKFTGYHCWAEFYAKDYGWVPVDISEAWKHKEKYGYYFGALDENRLELSKGRDITLAPAQNGEPLNYFIYPYVEIDGKGFDNVETSFEVKDVS